MRYKSLLSCLMLGMIWTLGAYSLEGPTIDQEDWPWWRGPNRNGAAVPGQDVVTRWADDQNVIWKTPVVGRGHSSPTVVGNQIVMATADNRRQTQSVIAFDRSTGEPTWTRQISQGGFPKTHPKNTHATCTLASDGERFFVTFHHHAQLTLAALDVKGVVVWSKEIGPFDPRRYQYGYAPSPLIYDSLVIVAADYEKGGYLAAFDRESGDEIWRTKRPNKLSFSSPVVARIAGKDQLLISGCDLVSSYLPKTGKSLWRVPGTTMATCGTMVWDGEYVIASGGYPKAGTICVKADGSRKVAWTNNRQCYEQSMLAHDGHLYATTDRGIAYCWRIRDGEEKWRERLTGPVSASPVLVNGNIYQSVEDGTTYVFKADPGQFSLVARNKLGDEAFASPSVCGGSIYLRPGFHEGSGRQEYLYKIGKK